MNTNAVNNIVSAGTEIVDSVKSLGPELFTVLACVILGYALKFIPFIRNAWIPCILTFIAGPGIYCSVGSPDMESMMWMRFPMARQVVLGIVWGFASWMVHRAFLRDSWIEKKLFGNGNNKTNTIPDSAS